MLTGSLQQARLQECALSCRGLYAQCTAKLDSLTTWSLSSVSSHRVFFAEECKAWPVLPTELDFSPKSCECAGLHSLLMRNKIHHWNIWQRCDKLKHKLLRLLLTRTTKGFRSIICQFNYCCHHLRYCSFMLRQKYKESEAVLFHFLRMCSVVDPVLGWRMKLCCCIPAVFLTHQYLMENLPLRLASRGPTSKINKASVVYDTTIRWCNLPS